MGIAKSFMKNQSGRQGKTNKSLLLEGGGKRVGVKELRVRGGNEREENGSE